MNGIKKHYREIKTALRKQKIVDPYFVSKYSFSPYMACEHGCVYCDGRAEKYYVEGDYERDIVIRKNLPEILQKEISKLRENGTVFIGSGISDAYQPVEKEEQLMRQCAEIIAESHLSATVLTKSSLIERDFDIWKKVHRKNGFSLMISLTFADDDLRKIFEPKASSVQARINVLKKFKAAGIPTGVMAMPFLPFISDGSDNIKTLLTKLKEAKIDFVIPGLLTLRPGKQKEFFMRTIEKYFPTLLSKYEKIYGNNLRSGSPIYSYRNEASRKIGKLISLSGISQEIPHYIYKNRFPLYDEIYILLAHMKNLYERKNIDVFPLKNAIKKYYEWLLTEKIYLNRHRTLNMFHLEEKLKQLFETGKFRSVLENQKLYEFLRQIVIDRKTFDYETLKLK